MSVEFWGGKRTVVMGSVDRRAILEWVMIRINPN
jgi:hypothetical protein